MLHVDLAAAQHFVSPCTSPTFGVKSFKTMGYGKERVLLHITVDFATAASGKGVCIIQQIYLMVGKFISNIIRFVMYLLQNPPLCYSKKYGDGEGGGKVLVFPSPPLCS
jgi:hypothetical protein